MVKTTAQQKSKAIAIKKLNAEMRRRNSLEYPECIKAMLFPECTIIIGEILGSCFNCPYFNINNYIKEAKKMVEVNKLNLEEYESKMKAAMTEREFDKWKSDVLPRLKNDRGEGINKTATREIKDFVAETILKFLDTINIDDTHRRKCLSHALFLISERNK